MRNSFFHSKTGRVLLFAIDVLIMNSVLLMLFGLIFPRSVDLLKPVITVGLPTSAFVLALVYALFGVHKVTWGYARTSDCAFLVVYYAIVYFFSAATTILFTSLEFSHIYAGCYIGAWGVSSIILVALRFLIKKIFKKNNKKHKMESDSELKDFGRSMIIGGGSAARDFIKEITENGFFGKCQPVAVIDDDLRKRNTVIFGVPVLGTRNDIIRIAEDLDVKTIFFAISSIEPSEKKAILNICKDTKCELIKVPDISEFVSGDSFVNQIKRVEVEDLLGREPIKIDVESIIGYVRDRVVMVTGGGGSIGSELCRQIASHKPKKLIIFDIYENNAYEIQNELIRNHPDTEIITLIGSVRDEKRLDQVFDKYRPEIVYHAAAHKHVPLMEDSPNEAVKNNVFGTLNTVRCADKYGVFRFVLISTDKAVNPTNVMGASKRMCEMIIQTYNNRSKTEYVAVRFGNVLGSNGSVIPLFRRQMEEGGPITVTHPDIIRYFMTIPEAVSLVLQAGATATGGEIFVLDMGEPVKILDLAKNMIRLSGFTLGVDMNIEFTGLRPGEKLYEELLMDEEGLKSTDNKLIYIGHPIVFDEEHYLEKLDELKAVMYDDSVDIRSYISALVPTYVLPENIDKINSKLRKDN